MKYRLIAVLLALVSVTALLGGCGAKNDVSSGTPQRDSRDLDPHLRQLAPQDVNVLTGESLDKDTPKGLRPVSVMVGNNPSAMPQRGLGDADVVYELLVEGGITRLMAVYSNPGTVPQVGPVRSTRDAFVQLAVPLNSIHAHIGGSVYAENLLNTLTYQDLDGYYLGSTTFSFDNARTQPRPDGKAAEDCWFTDAALIEHGMEQMELPATGDRYLLFNFTDSAPDSGDDAAHISYAYAEASEAAFDYNPELASYAKSLYGKPHADEGDAVLNFTNVFLLFSKTRTKTDDYTLEYDFNGGSGYYFCGGKAQPIRWEKGEPTEPLRLYTEEGKTLPVLQGTSFIGFVPQAQAKEVRYYSAYEMHTANSASGTGG